MSVHCKLEYRYLRLTACIDTEHTRTHPLSKPGSDAMTFSDIPRFAILIFCWFLETVLNAKFDPFCISIATL